MKLTAVLRNAERLAREIGERVANRMQTLAGRPAKPDAPWMLGGDAWPGLVPARALATRRRVRR